MEFEALIPGATPVLIVISALGLMLRMNRLFVSLSADVSALSAKVDGLAGEVAENREEIQRVRTELRAEMREELGQLRGEMDEGFRVLRAEISEGDGLLRGELGQLRVGMNEGFRLLRSETSEEFRLSRTERQESVGVLERKIERLDDKVDANGVSHDANLKEVGRQVSGLNARVSRVEGYIVAAGEWPGASGQ